MCIRDRAGTASVEVGLHGGHVQLQPGRAPIDDAADADAVGLAEGGDAEQPAGGTGHATSIAAERTRSAHRASDGSHATISG